MSAAGDRPPVSGHWTEIRQALGIHLASSRQRVTFRDNLDVERTGSVVFWPGKHAALDSPHQPIVNVRGQRFPIRWLVEVHWAEPREITDRAVRLKERGPEVNLRMTHTETIDQTGLLSISVPLGATPIAFHSLHCENVARLSFVVPDRTAGAGEPIVLRITADDEPIYDDDSPLGDYVGTALLNDRVTHCFWIHD